ncbi:deoxyhypusine hydroxylase [Tilletia horrida]|nr:deoxyhypusine hydroxylase [Tilletia horrida]
MASTSSMSAPSAEFAQLERSLLSTQTPLDARFRALFELRGLANAGSEADAHAAIDIIARGFSDDSALLKHELAYVLGQIANPYANASLVAVLKNTAEDPMVRHEAAEALGAISSPESLPVLQEYINDADVSVRETCELAIEKIKYDHGDEAKAARAQREAAQAARPALSADADADAHEHAGEQDEDEAFAPIDPAPSFASAALGGGSGSSSSSSRTAADAEAAAPSVGSLSSSPSHTRDLLTSYRTTLLAGDKLSLWERYRAMFSLRNVVHAAARASEKCQQTAAKTADASVRQEQSQLAAEWDKVGNDAVLALADGLQDKSALFRHEICFVFGELSHPASIPSMIRVLADSAEHEMVRHEAAEALGGIAEEAAESSGDQADAERASIDDVVKELKRWAEDMNAPRVVRESCIVALDEMAYNNDPTQFQRVEGSGLAADVPSLPASVAAA